MPVYDWSEVPATRVEPGIFRQVVQGEMQTMVRYRYQPGSRFPEHSHPEEQITLVISGLLEFHIAGERVLLGPGEAAVIPAGVPHSARNQGYEVAVTFNAMSPRRERHPSPGTEPGAAT